MLRNILFQLLALISNIVTPPWMQARFHTVCSVKRVRQSRARPASCSPCPTGSRRTTPPMRESVPKADPERFSVLVAKLKGDAADTLGNQIFEVLREFPGVQTLSLDRTLAGERRMSEDEEITAGEKARQYLQQSEASVLIWGSVLD